MKEIEKLPSYYADLKLVQPTMEMEREYLEYIAEWRNAGEKIIPMASNLGDGSFEDWLNKIAADRNKKTCTADSVPADTDFLMDQNGKILGAVNIRRKLNEFLLQIGGNIGYGVRPSERRKGIAKHMLGLALLKCKEMGMKKVLVTCDKDNIASANTILANGGLLENEVPYNGKTKQRYWISLT